VIAQTADKAGCHEQDEVSGQDGVFNELGA
jgi:hypothetical protein